MPASGVAKSLTTADRSTVWVDKELLAKGHIVRVQTGESISELVERLLRPVLHREYVKAVAALNRDLGGES